MSASVLFDAPGPKTVARHRIYSVISVVALLALIAFAVWKLYDAGQLEYDLWEPFVTPDYLEYILVDGLLETLKMAFFSIIFAVVFGLVFGVAKLSDRGWVRWPAWLVVEFFRAVPVLLLMIFIFFSYGVGDGIGSFWSVVIALTLYNGSVLAEVFRAGIDSVHPSQRASATALGLSDAQSLRHVVLPQAVRRVLPPLLNDFVSLQKDTALVATVGLVDALGTAADTANYTFNYTPYLVAAALFVALTVPLARLTDWVGRRAMERERAGAR